LIDLFQQLLHTLCQAGCSYNQEVASGMLLVH